MKIKYLLISLMLFFMAAPIKAQTWEDLGPNTIVANGKYCKVGINDSIPYVIYADATNGYRVTLKKFNGDTWQLVGYAGFTEPNVTDLAFAFDGTNIYVAYAYQDPLQLTRKIITVKCFDGTNWEYVGEPLESVEDLNALDLKIDSHKLYVGYTSGRLQIIKIKLFNDGYWQENDVHYYASIDGSAFTIDNQISYQAYIDNNGANVVRVVKFDWTEFDPDNPQNWTSVSSSGLSNYLSFEVKIVVNQNIPYLAYIISSGNYINKAVVQKFNGNTWVNVGNSDISIGQKTNQISIAFDGNTPYIVYDDILANQRTVIVKKFNGTSWEIVGTGGLPNETVNNLSIAIANQQIIVTYGISSTNNIYVKKYTLFKLKSFEATKDDSGKAQLNWKTSSESNNDHFIVEKSKDAKTFVMLESIATKGNGNRIQTYQLTDENPFKGYTYYRLSQIDINGQVTILGIKSILMNNWGNWEDLGNINTAIAKGKDYKIVINESIPYVIYTDAENEYRATIKRFNGSEWELAGNAGFTEPNANNLNVVFEGGIIYVAYSYKNPDDANEEIIKVKLFDGFSWSDAGSSPIETTKTVISIALTKLDGQQAYIKYQCYDGSNMFVKVKRLEDNIWKDFSHVVETNANLDESAFIIDYETAYVAYINEEGNHQNPIKVKKFDLADYNPDNLIDWQAIEQTGIYSGISTEVKMAVNQNTPYLAFRKHNGNTNKLTVQKFIENSWLEVGSSDISDGLAVSNSSLAFDGNIPYIVYVDSIANSKAVIVKRFNETNWETGGSEEVPNEIASNKISIVTDNQSVLVAYSYLASDTDKVKIFIKKYMLNETLPVSLTKFEASKNAFGEALLSWETTSESNNDFFVLEKSQDAKNFKLLDKIKSKGDGHTHQIYQEIDKNPFIGYTYYRLSQTDKDGKTKELGVKSVLINQLNTSYSIYPNPVYQQVFNLNIADLEGDKEILFYDFSGKEILKQHIVFENGKTTVTLAQNLAKGIYLINVTGTKVRAKLVVE